MATIKGGKRLEAALRNMAANVTKAASVDIGFLEGATYPDGTSVPLVAAINEYGRAKIGQPPRPFFRNMIAAKSAEWPTAVGDLLLEHNYDAAATLDDVGKAITTQLVESIEALTSPPLKPETAARKGFAKPLVDTGYMRNSAHYIVKS